MPILKYNVATHINYTWDPEVVSSTSQAQVAVALVHTNHRQCSSPIGLIRYNRWKALLKCLLRWWSQTHKQTNSSSHTRNSSSWEAEPLVQPRRLTEPARLGRTQNPLLQWKRSYKIRRKSIIPGQISGHRNQTEAEKQPEKLNWWPLSGSHWRRRSWGWALRFSLEWVWRRAAQL